MQKSTFPSYFCTFQPGKILFVKAHVISIDYQGEKGGLGMPGRMVSFSFCIILCGGCKIADVQGRAGKICITFNLKLCGHGWMESLN